jgi:hypothetical protein
MTHDDAAERHERPLSAASRRSTWAHRTAYACWTIERLEHVELVAARYGIRRAAPSSALINYYSKPISHASTIHCALLQGAFEDIVSLVGMQSYP